MITLTPSPFMLVALAFLVGFMCGFNLLRNPAAIQEADLALREAAEREAEAELIECPSCGYTDAKLRPLRRA